MVYRALGKSPRLAGDHGSSRKDDRGGRSRREGRWRRRGVQHRARGRERQGCRRRWGWRWWRWGVWTSKPEGWQAIWLYCQHVQCPSGKWVRVITGGKDEQEYMSCSFPLTLPWLPQCTFHSLFFPKSAFLLIYSCSSTPHDMTWHDPFSVNEPICFFLLYTEHIHVSHAVPLLCLFIHEAYSWVLLPGTSLVWFDLISPPLPLFFLHVVEQNNFPEPGIINQLVLNLFIVKLLHSCDAKVQERMMKQIRSTVNMMSFTGATL